MLEANLGAAAFKQHELRARILGELHARPTRPLESPARVLHFGFLLDSGQAEADREAVVSAALARGLPGPDATARQYRVEMAGVSLTWERHGEFVTHSWEFSGEENLFDPTPAALMQKVQLLPQPGPLLVAADLHLLSGDTDPAILSQVFEPLQPAVSEANHGRALIASDFAPDTFGFVRLVVINRSMPAMASGRLTQRLLEIETYRTLALLGLPEAQRLGPSMREIETKLPRLLATLNQSKGVAQNRELLDEITGLAAQLETESALSLYRFGATHAYNDLVQERLEAIDETALPDYPSWNGFLTRRLQPAIRTCFNVESRQADLSRKLSRAAELLRTRVDTEVEQQNGDLLRQMGERVQLQLRLQQTVEGLSVAAITYYISSVLLKVLEGAHEAGAQLNPTVWTGAAIPFIAGFVWWTVRQIRKRHFEE
ncbi:Uncharacterized membrane-anchored protein [Rhodoblastus acidophilus]|uniref:Uncharacterized membrane-anchored protein n=1 Tax=Rhodoblastus acidophilus TaxID=1074 RepID=A0A212QZ29_RHOAC|nr:DUF3422 domain-containing protein [Rhodoblastus acidophilus]MCW2315596.1 putative membrane-anchored protein [Rhodoblastus acidophilus]PPQ40574.1 DUF3422 domain-containing protein [Rhodoblastus acidophilus]RAI22926.1 DUF3422 domain-containing protein [Rhodoblastus acidophilus]SNB64836.1 Uncharacterized membrane-anchored protein [Rhodoblastus acidophilus]